MNRKLITDLTSKRNRFVLLLFCLFQILFLTKTNAQTLSVTGTVKWSGNQHITPMKYVSITFINSADTTIRYSALTNASGYYQIDLTVTSVEPGKNLPTKFELEQNYPNPFSSSTDIPYQLKKESNVEVTIYDILGRVVKKFNAGQQSVGVYNVLWDGRNNFGEKVASGVYFYKLSTDGESQVKKMVFNQNANGSFSIPHSYSITGNSSSIQGSKTQSVQGNTFTIRFENTSTTLPAIVPQELQNVVIQKDTTINLSVDYIPTATIDFDSLHQIIRGFGGANIVTWRPDMTDSEINTAFGKGDGQLGLTILRLAIDSLSSNWSRSVPTAKKAYDMGAKIIASPWYAPSNMTEMVPKKIGDTTITISRVRHDMYSEYVAHLNSFIAYMENNGVPIYGISVSNEPDSWGQWTNWEPNEMFTFVKYYADSIKGAQVMDPESFYFDTSYSGPILRDSAAAANTDIICGHIYHSGWSSQSLAEQKGKEIWMTEYLIDSGNPPKHLDIDTGWTSGAMPFAKSLNGFNGINNVMNADMNTYIYWFIVRYYGLIADGTYATKGEVTKKGYVMSQFARFVRPGFYRVESRVYQFSPSVSLTAYKDPSSFKVVIVAINSDSTETETIFRIQDGVITKTFTPYTTSATKNCEQGSRFNVNGDSFTFNLEPSSITTFVSN